jgi:cysteine-rich repeat protein
VVSFGLGESCEDGVAITADCADFGFVDGPLACLTDLCEVDTSECALPVCGDGDREGGEGCDDHNQLDYDGCSANCFIERCVRGRDSDEDGTDDCDDVETCDGIDNNGNGVVDERITEELDATPCYTGDEGSEDVGVCLGGRWGCLAGEWVCQGQNTASDELCNGRDDDCDEVIPSEEAEAGCATAYVAGMEPLLASYELALTPASQDWVINLDNSSSMIDSLLLETGRCRGVASWSGLSRICPGAGDLPGHSHRPVRDAATCPALLAWVSRDARRVLRPRRRDCAAAGISESSIEAMYQAATGTGSTWSGATALRPGPPVVGIWRVPGRDLDDYLPT